MQARPITTRVATTVVALAVLLAGSTVAGGARDERVVRDAERETRGLVRKAELDIVRADAGRAAGGRLRHRIRMRGALKPRKVSTRPFILINTRGGRRSSYEYVVAGRRVLQETRDGRFRRVGRSGLRANRSKRTWIYRFGASAFGDPRAYGWAALTSKGRTTDLAPNRRFARHRIGR